MDDDAKQAIADRWSNYVDAWLRGDAEEVLSFWTADMRFLEPGGDLDKSAYGTGVRGFLGSGGKLLRMDMEPFEIFVHGDVAYQLGQVEITIQFEGQDSTDMATRFFSRWEKQPDGMWRISRILSGPKDAPTQG
jgi:ketosteroid isomerase-like protein